LESPSVHLARSACGSFPDATNGVHAADPPHRVDLDIDIVMPSYKVFPDIIAHLRRLGYTHNGDQGMREREAFKPLDNTAPYTLPPRKWMSHHLYVCPADSLELRRHLIFRDALRVRGNLRQEYEKRKLDIVERSGSDRKVYAQIKEIECRDFVDSVLTANSKTHLAQDTSQVGTKASSASSRAAQPLHRCHTLDPCTASRRAQCWHAPFP